MCPLSHWSINFTKLCSRENTNNILRKFDSWGCCASLYINYSYTTVVIEIKLHFSHIDSSFGGRESPSPSWKSKIGCDTNVIITVVLFIFHIFLLTDLFLFKSEIFLLRTKIYSPLIFSDTENYQMPSCEHKEIEDLWGWP